MSDLTVIEAGIFASFQDAGRLGYEQFGVAQSGAFDRYSWRVANELVGNEARATSGGPATLEVVLGGFRIVANRAVQISCAGAHRLVEHRVADGVQHRRTPVSINLAVGDELVLDRTREGIRTYLAVRGGFDVPPILGSRSYDSTAQLGPRPVTTGDGLTVGSSPSSPVDHEVVRPVVSQMSPLGIYVGPHTHLLAGGLASLTSNTWRVTPETSRAGVRIGGNGGLRNLHACLPSVPTMPGTIQLLPTGDLTVFGPDCPVTGGYPFVALVADRSLDQVAQIRPGTAITFKALGNDSS